MSHVAAYGATSAGAALVPLTIERREVRANDVRIAILYCGICHTDLHFARGEVFDIHFPVVPGHEMVGRVLAIGPEVTRYRVGDLVGVGTFVDSCRVCPSCQEDLQQHCEKGVIGTYNAPDRHLGGHTFGGYSKEIVVDEEYVLRIPTSLPLHAVAPLLCAGITMWSPLRRWQAGPGKAIGIAGLGGLGHMGVKLAKALGARVAVLTTSASKVADAQRLGADAVVLTTDSAQMREAVKSLDLIIDTVSGPHDPAAYMGLLKRDGTHVLLSAPSEPHAPLDARHLIFNRLQLAGSLVGGLRSTQEMLDFCGEHTIVPEVEVISADGINGAFERLSRGDVRYRFVIDNTTL